MRGRVLLCSCSLMAALAAPVRAEEPTGRVYTLEELVDSAMSRNAEIAQGAWKVAGARAVLRQARAARLLPRLRLDSENGLVPDARGNVFGTLDDSTGFFRSLGPFNRTELEFVQPLYTFGQLTNLGRAATGGVAVEEAALDEKRAEVTLAVKKLYYGLLLAQDLRDLAAKLATKLAEKQAELAGRESLSLANGYKLKLAMIELAERRREAEEKVTLARAALAWQTGLPEDAPLMLADEWLAPVEAAVPPLPELIAAAEANRPDWRRLQAGLAARQAQYRAARGAFYPQVYLAGGVRYATAPGRTDQHNPFVKDEFNYFNAGLFVGVRQSFEWGLLGAEADKTRAAYEELKTRERDAGRALALDVRRAYAEYQRADLDQASADESRHLARQWLQEAQSEYELDPDTLKDLVTAFETWARLEQAFHEAVYHRNLKLAELEKTAGGVALKRP
ncbi:MAG: TolC family protein [Candidatus Latescibacterota bacterium]